MAIFVAKIKAFSMKRMYVRPMAEIEEFISNEYITACWGVACTVPTKGKTCWRHNHGNNKVDEKDMEHSKDHCGTATNQYIVELPGGGFKMTEINTDGLGELVCTVTNMSTSEMPRKGTTIKWTTSAKDGRTWYHSGTVDYSDTSRPNHS